MELRFSQQYPAMRKSHFEATVHERIKGNENRIEGFTYNVPLIFKVPVTVSLP